MQRGMSICCNLVNIKSYQLRKLVTITIPQYSYSTKYPSLNYLCAEVSGGLPSSMKLIIECVQFVQVSLAEPSLLKKQDVTFFKKFINHQTSCFICGTVSCAGALCNLRHNSNLTVCLCSQEVTYTHSPSHYH